MLYYLCPCCHQLTSENFKNEDDKVVCQRIVNRGGKLVQCGFYFYVNEYNTYTMEGKRYGTKKQEKNGCLGL